MSSESTQQSAAAPSPFPPIADYAFLSNCHTGALVAPDGAIDWLYVPRFDSPSVFASLLDRQAGFFRLGPFGIIHPAARAYEPGTNVLETTWNTTAGWILVRDALTVAAMNRALKAAVRCALASPVSDEGRLPLPRQTSHTRTRSGIEQGGTRCPDDGWVEEAYAGGSPTAQEGEARTTRRTATIKTPQDKKHHLRLIRGQQRHRQTRAWTN